MNIGFYTSRVDYYDTGPGIYRENLARALLRNKSASDTIKFIHYKKYNSNIYHGNNEIIIPQPPILSKIGRALLDREIYIGRSYNFLTEGHLTRNYDFDILHLQSVPYKRFFWLWDIDAKVVTTIHGNLTNLWMRKLAKHFDAIFTVSKSSKKLLTKRVGINPEKLFVTYNAVSPLFKPTKNKRILKEYEINQPYIFHLSNASKRKNPKGIIRGFEKAVREKNIEHELVIGGSRWKKKDFTKNLKTKESLKKIRFLGHLPRKVLPSLYTHADFFFFPSFSEGFGIPLLESISCGTPVLTTDAYAMPEIASKGGVYIKDPGDYDEMGNKIEEILNNKEKLGKDALKRSKKFSWDNTAKKTLRVYKRIL